MVGLVTTLGAYVYAKTTSIRYVPANPSSEALSQDSGSELLFFQVAVRCVLRFVLKSLLAAAWRDLGLPNLSRAQTIPNNIT